MQFPSIKKREISLYTTHRSLSLTSESNTLSLNHPKRVPQLHTRADSLCVDCIELGHKTTETLIPREMFLKVVYRPSYGKPLRSC